MRFVKGGEALTVRLSIAPEGLRLRATLSLDSKGREPVVRHIESPDCDDALDALALVVAISVESRSRELSERARPRRSRRARPPARRQAREQPAPPEVVPESAASEPDPQLTREPASPPPSAPLPVVAPASEPAPAPAELGSPPRAPIAPAATARQGIEPESAPPPEPRARLVFAGGIAAQLLVGAAPTALLGGQIWGRARWERDALFSPELGLSVGHQRLDGFDEPAGQVDFGLSAASLDLCPLRLGRSDFHVQPCLSGSLGRLRSKGEATLFPGGETRPWATWGGNVQLVARWHVVELRGSLGLAQPLVRDGFRFGPACAGASCEAGVFHRVEPVVWLSTLGAGLAFD